MVSELSKYVIVKLVGCDETVFNKMKLTEALRCIQQGALQDRWADSSIHSGLLALRQLFAFLDARNILHEGCTTGSLVTLFLLETKETNQAKRKHTQEEKEAEASTTDDEEALHPACHGDN